MGYRIRHAWRRRWRGAGGKLLNWKSLSFLVTAGVTGGRAWFGGMGWGNYHYGQADAYYQSGNYPAAAKMFLSNIIEQFSGWSLWTGQFRWQSALDGWGTLAASMLGARVLSKLTHVRGIKFPVLGTVSLR